MTISGKQSDPQNPLGDLEEWDDFVKERYPEPADKQALVGTNPEKTEEQFRDYEADARSSVREFYRLNHRGQTLDFVRQKRDEYLSLNQRGWPSLRICSEVCNRCASCDRSVSGSLSSISVLRNSAASQTPISRWLRLKYSSLF